MANTHPRANLLRAHAVGSLSPGLTLLVGTHLGFCRCCREKVAGLEALCGALLAEGECAGMARRCCNEALSRLDGERQAAEAQDRLAGDGPLSADPVPMVRAAPPCGVREYPVAGFAAERVVLVLACPGERLRDGDEAETMLVLNGGLRSGTAFYQAGDIVGDAWSGARAEGREGCLCLRVEPAPASAAADPLLGRRSA